MHVFPSVNELLKMKEDLTKERDEQLQEISRLREELSEANARQSELEQKKAEADEKIQEVSLVFHLGGRRVEERMQAPAYVVQRQGVCMQQMFWEWN